MTSHQFNDHLAMRGIARCLDVRRLDHFNGQEKFCLSIFGGRSKPWVFQPIENLVRIHIVPPRNLRD